MGKKISQLLTEETSALSDTDVFEGEETGGTSFKVLFSVLKSTLKTYFDAVTTTLTNKTLTTPTIADFTNANHTHMGATGGGFIGNLPRGVMLNGKLSVTVSSNDLVVAIKTLAGADPSASDPVYVRIGDTIRTITAATSFTLADGTNWFNSGSAELGTKEIDYFAYVVWDSNSSVVAVSASRIPFGNLVSEFVSSTTSEKHLANYTNFTGTDEVEVIGRFAATLSLSGTSHLWTVPTFTAINLIQRPIYETRWLTWTPDFPTVTAMTVTGETIVTSRYKIRMEVLSYQIRLTAFTIGGTPNSTVANTLPFDAINDVQLTGAMLAADAGGTAFGGNRINAATPDLLYWIKDGAAAWAAGAGTVLNGNGWYEI